MHKTLVEVEPKHNFDLGVCCAKERRKRERKPLWKRRLLLS
jgi:hypothetical protein